MGQKQRDNLNLSVCVDLFSKVANTGFSMCGQKSNSCWLVAIFGWTVYLVLYAFDDDDNDSCHLLSIFQVLQVNTTSAI